MSAKSLSKHRGGDGDKNRSQCDADDWKVGKVRVGGGGGGERCVEKEYVVGISHYYVNPPYMKGQPRVRIIKMSYSMNTPLRECRMIVEPYDVNNEPWNLKVDGRKNKKRMKEPECLPLLDIAGGHPVHGKCVSPPHILSHRTPYRRVLLPCSSVGLCVL